MYPYSSLETQAKCPAKCKQCSQNDGSTILAHGKCLHMQTVCDLAIFLNASKLNALKRLKIAGKYKKSTDSLTS